MISEDPAKSFPVQNFPGEHAPGPLAGPNVRTSAAFIGCHTLSQAISYKLILAERNSTTLLWINRKVFVVSEGLCISI